MPSMQEEFNRLTRQFLPMGGDPWQGQGKWLADSQRPSQDEMADLAEMINTQDEEIARARNLAPSDAQQMAGGQPASWSPLSRLRPTFPSDGTRGVVNGETSDLVERLESIIENNNPPDWYQQKMDRRLKGRSEANTIVETLKNRRPTTAQRMQDLGGGRKTSQGIPYMRAHEANLPKQQRDMSEGGLAERLQERMAELGSSDKYGWHANWMKPGRGATRKTLATKTYDKKGKHTGYRLEGHESQRLKELAAPYRAERKIKTQKRVARKKLNKLIKDSKRRAFLENLRKREMLKVGSGVNRNQIAREVTFWKLQNNATTEQAFAEFNSRVQAAHNAWTATNLSASQLALKNQEHTNAMLVQDRAALIVLAGLKGPTGKRARDKLSRIAGIVKPEGTIEFTSREEWKNAMGETPQGKYLSTYILGDNEDQKDRNIIAKKVAEALESGRPIPAELRQIIDAIGSILPQPIGDEENRPWAEIVESYRKKIQEDLKSKRDWDERLRRRNPYGKGYGSL